MADDAAVTRDGGTTLDVSLRVVGRTPRNMGQALAFVLTLCERHGIDTTTAGVEIQQVWEYQQDDSPAVEFYDVIVTGSVVA